MQQLKPVYTNSSGETLSVVSLLQRETALSATRIRKWVDAALVWSDGAPLLSSKSTLASGQRCYIDLDFLDAKGAFKKVQPQILYDSPEWIAINKPAGCDSLELKEILTLELGIALTLVHRLDRMTSGVMVMAKTSDAKRQLDRLFREQKMKKIYCALCRHEEDQETIPSISEQKWAFWQDTLVKKKDRLYSSMMVKAQPGQKGERAALYAGRIQARESASLFAFYLQSGKMHQIRAQCSFRHLAIVGDRQYQIEQLESSSFSSLCYGGHFLHAYSLRVPASFSGKEISIRAPFPKAWARALTLAQIKGRSLDRIINPSTPPEGRILSQNLETKILSFAPKENRSKENRSKENRSKENRSRSRLISPKKNPKAASKPKSTRKTPGKPQRKKVQAHKR